MSILKTKIKSRISGNIFTLFDYYNLHILKADGIFRRLVTNLLNPANNPRIPLNTYKVTVTSASPEMIYRF